MLRSWYFTLCAVLLHVASSDDNGLPKAPVTNGLHKASLRRVDSGHGSPHEETYEEEADAMFEEKHTPHHLKGILYALLTPVIGFLMVMFAFPVLYFNERRATKPHQRHDAAHAHDEKPADPKAEGYKEVGQTGGAGAGATEEEHKDEKHHLSAKEKTKEMAGKASEKADEAVHQFEQKVCWCACCKAVDKCCDKIPERGNVGHQTWGIRFLGFFMIWFGMNMFLYPLYFILHCIPFIGAFLALGLASCVCKMACCGWCSTMFTSYSLHHPIYLILFIVLCIGLLALNIYLMGQPEHHHHPSEYAGEAH